MGIILSCTTTKSRLPIFYYGIQSLLRQSLAPDVLLVNLCRRTFGSDGAGIPDWIKNNARVNLVEDVRSYTKLLPALDVATDDDFIVTADDDILYHEDWLSQLISGSEKNSESLICARARIMTKGYFGSWRNYGRWPVVREDRQGIDLLPLGVGGVVYQKPLLDMDFIRDRAFLDIAPSTDDLWFKMASMRIETNVVAIPGIDIANMPIMHPLGLEQINFQLKPGRWVSRKFRSLTTVLADMMDINLTKNDAAWDAIVRYSRKKDDTLK